MSDSLYLKKQYMEMISGKQGYFPANEMLCNYRWEIKSVFDC